MPKITNAKNVIFFDVHRKTFLSLVSDIFFKMKLNAQNNIDMARKKKIETKKMYYNRREIRDIIYSLIFLYFIIFRIFFINVYQ